MSENTELVTVNVTNIAAAPVGSMVCSIKPDGNRETAAKIYAAMNNPEHRLADFINKKLNITDYLIEVAEIANEETGEISIVPRVVLIAEDGKSYQATSYGIANSVRNLVQAVGNAPWQPALQLEVKQRPTKRGSMLTLALIG